MQNKTAGLILIFVLATSCIEAPSKKSSVNKTEQAQTTTYTSSPVPTLTSTPVPNVTATYTPTATPTASESINIPDPLISYAWHLNNIGQSTFSSSAGSSGVDLALSAVNETGAGVLVAVSDNGVERQHEDLATNFKLEFSKNYAQNSSGGWSGDPVPGDSAHGTSVAGIIAAQKNNGLGSAGVAPEAMLAGLKYIGTPYSTSALVDQANGLYDIFNYSYGGYTCSFTSLNSAYIDQLKYGVENLRGGRGAIYVKAGGNEYISKLSDCYSYLDDEENQYYLGNANLEQDHAYPYYIVVAAVNASGVSASYSSPGSSLWISAPGGEFGTDSPAILTTDLSGCSEGFSQVSANENSFESGSNNLNSQCNYTSTMNGTSAATPMVSGVVARMLQANSALSWRDIKYILAKTAVQVDANRGVSSHPLGYDLAGHTYQLGWITNGAGYHFHNWYGFGLINTLAAVNMAKNYSFPLESFKTQVISSSGSLDLSIPDNSASGRVHSLSMPQGLNIEAVQVKLNITHSYIGDLGIELTSPAGTKSILMNINSGLIAEDIYNQVLLSNAFYGENAYGTWTLKIIDGYAQDTGKLNQWSITFYGH